ncbi:MAG TPA: hypothetical protein VGN24_07960 [Rhodanobacter sp.]|jgi:hypothetical protein|nr:hypothetical protein [Rhodanobacter sp.]
MKLVRLALTFGALALCTGTASAEPASLNQFRPKVLPVLVQVNSHGRVTEASPSIELSPRLARLLRENLDEMIRRPATDEHGRPMSSQFVINLALQATPQSKDKYDVRFAYVSTSPVPAGSWYWVHIDGHQLALAPQHPGNFQQGIRARPYRYPPDHIRTFAPASTPPVRQTVDQAAQAVQAPPARGLERNR